MILQTPEEGLEFRVLPQDRGWRHPERGIAGKTVLDRYFCRAIAPFSSPISESAQAITISSRPSRDPAKRPGGKIHQNAEADPPGARTRLRARLRNPGVHARSRAVFFCARRKGRAPLPRRSSNVRPHDRRAVLGPGAREGGTHREGRRAEAHADAATAWLPRRRSPGRGGPRRDLP